MARCQSFVPTGGSVWMNDEESQTKFDSLVAMVEVVLEANLLTRIPSLKNMKRLTALLLAENKITR